MGKSAMDRNLLFSEWSTLEYNIDHLGRELSGLKISNVKLWKKDNLIDADEMGIKKSEASLPGLPTYRII